MSRKGTFADAVLVILVISRLVLRAILHIINKMYPTSPSMIQQNMFSDF